MFSMNIFKIVEWLLVLSLIQYVLLMLKLHYQMRSAQKLPETVVSYKEEKGSDGILYTLNVAYRDQSGEKHMATGSVSSSNPSKRKGDVVIRAEK